MRRKMDIIDECFSCPYSYHYEFDDKIYDYECGLSKRAIPPEKVHGIPEWCPLPDYEEVPKWNGPK